MNKYQQMFALKKSIQNEFRKILDEEYNNKTSKSKMLIAVHGEFSSDAPGISLFIPSSDQHPIIDVVEINIYGEGIKPHYSAMGKDNFKKIDLSLLINTIDKILKTEYFKEVQEKAA